MPNLVFHATIKDGKLYIDNRQTFDLYVGSMTGRARITIEKMKNIRTTGKPSDKSNMNGYYWLYLNLIEQETGNSAQDLHEYFKRVFLEPRFIKVLDKDIKLPGSSRELSGIEMWEYMEKIEALTGIQIPPRPDELIN